MCIQLADFFFRRLSFQPLQAGADGERSKWYPSDAAAGRPGRLLIEDVIDGPRAPAQVDEDNDGGDSDSDDDAAAAPQQPPGLPARQLNDLLEAALLPGAVLQRLVLSKSLLHPAALCRLPSVASLQCLEVLRCYSNGGMDAPLQALVQLAPALTSLRFEAPSVRHGGQPYAGKYLQSCPAYLLAHPSLRSVAVLNRRQDHWDMEEALSRLPSLGATAPGARFRACASPQLSGQPGHWTACQGLPELQIWWWACCCCCIVLMFLQHCALPAC